jgi:hypothetical protein
LDVTCDIIFLFRWNIMNKIPDGFVSIEGCGDKYFIGSCGNVYSNRSNGRGSILKPQYSGRKNAQYCTVWLYPTDSYNGVQHRIHRLVAKAFIPNPENKPCVNHIDGNKLNNTVDNLEWCTAKENSQHAYNTGLMTISTLCREKSRGASRKLNEDDIIDILNMSLIQKLKYPKIAELKGIAFGTVGKICRGERYKLEYARYFL